MPTYEAEKEHILEILAQLAVMKKACGSLGHEIDPSHPKFHLTETSIATST